MAGKRGLIMGVANERSIAWGIAQALHAAGAEMAFTYQGAAFGKRVLPMVEKLGSKIVEEADVENEESLDRLFDRLKKRLGPARLRGPRHRLLRQGGAEGPLCRHDQGQLPAQPRHLLLFLHRDRPPRAAADDRRRQPDHAHLRGRRPRDAVLQRHGRRQGGPRSQRALSRGRSRPAGRAGQCPSRRARCAPWPAR